MRFLSQVGVGLSHKSYRDESRFSRCLPPSSPYQLSDTHKCTALHGVYLSAESWRQLALLQDRHINPDSIHKVTYSCSAGAFFTAVYFGAGQFLAHTEINTAACVNTTPSPPLLKHFTCGCYVQKSYRNKHSQKCQLARQCGKAKPEQV